MPLFLVVSITNAARTTVIATATIKVTKTCQTKVASVKSSQLSFCSLCQGLYKSSELIKLQLPQSHISSMRGQIILQSTLVNKPNKSTCINSVNVAVYTL